MSIFKVIIEQEIIIEADSAHDADVRFDALDLNDIRSEIDADEQTALGARVIAGHYRKSIDSTEE